MSTTLLPTTNRLPDTPGEETRPSSPKPTSPDTPISRQTRGSALSRLVATLKEDVDNKRADNVSIYACLLTGFTASISFSVSLLISAIVIMG
jgi:hypothetical protein